MHIPDMQLLDGDRVAVGWLHADQAFPRGDVPSGFVAKLEEFARRYGDSARALGWGAMGGCHTCEFCGQALGFGSFGVPTGDRLFYAPDMIAHYVQRHGYAPPVEFIKAVLACPLPGTAEYVAAVAPFAVRFA